MNSKLKNISRILLTFISAVIVFVSFTIFIVSGIYRYKLNDVDFYADKIITQEFDDNMMVGIREKIESNNEVLALPVDDVLKTLPVENLLKIRRDYTVSIIDSVLNGSAVIETALDFPQLKDIIENTYEDRATDAEKNSAYKMLVGYITAKVFYMPSVIKEVTPILNSAVKKIDALSDSFYFAGAAFIIFSLIIFLLNRSYGIINFLYIISIPIWTSTAAMFIPMLIIKVYDITSGLTLKTSGIYFFIAGIIDSVEYFLPLLIVIFAIATLFVGITIYLKLKTFNNVGINEQ